MEVKEWLLIHDMQSFGINPLQELQVLQHSKWKNANVIIIYFTFALFGAEFFIVSFFTNTCVIHKILCFVTADALVAPFPNAFQARIMAICIFYFIAFRKIFHIWSIWGTHTITCWWYNMVFNTRETNGRV